MRLLRTVVVTVAGVLLVLVGVAMLVLPGPGILMLVAGFAVLATEYAWAQVLLRRAKARALVAQRAAVANRWRTIASIVSAVGAVALGVAVVVVAVAVPDVAWPVADDRIDQFWSPVIGVVMAVTGLIVLTTTVLALRLGVAEARATARAGGGGATAAPRPAPVTAGRRRAAA